MRSTYVCLVTLGSISESKNSEVLRLSHSHYCMYLAQSPVMSRVQASCDNSTYRHNVIHSVGSAIEMRSYITCQQLMTKNLHRPLTNGLYQLISRAPHVPCCESIVPIGSGSWHDQPCCSSDQTCGAASTNMEGTVQCRFAMLRKILAARPALDALI